MDSVFIDPAPISPRILDDGELGETKVGIALPAGRGKHMAYVVTVTIVMII